MSCLSAGALQMPCAKDKEKWFEEQQLKSQRLSKSTKQLCFRLMPSKGKDFFEAPKMPKKIKPTFCQFVKSKTPTLSHAEDLRLKNAAKVVTVEERLEALAKKEELTKQRNENVVRVKNYFRKIDEQRLQNMEAITKKGEDLSGSKQKQQTLELAFLAKQEQEEEVQAVNRFILHAKCQAIRDAQMQEKKDIERFERNEQIRLERMVIDENAKALAKEDTLAYKRKERSAKYASEIREQLLQRENLRYMEAERAEDEAKARRLANLALQREEELAISRARERRLKFRAELDQIVEMSNLFKKMLCEQERETDLRVEAYMREKREQEKQLEREKQLAREEFERKQQILYQLAQKLMASKSQREELNYLREQEHAEREYRRREKESAERRKRLEDGIKESRLRQLQETKTRQALQIAREENDFKVMINNLKKEEERLKKEEQLRERRQKCYALDVKSQISNKAIAHRQLLENERNEANTIREAERKRLENVRIVIGAKLAAMREACLPELYIKDIERQMDRIIKRCPPQAQRDVQ